jgi:AAA15 family ATPase/GTPase
MASEKVHIQNYKSLKDISFEAKKVNLFIGEPNSGKSNILEALSFFSLNSFSESNFKQMIRHASPTDLFFESDINNRIEILFGKYRSVLFYAFSEFKAPLNHYDLELWGGDNPINIDKPDLYRISKDGVINNINFYGYQTRVKNFIYKRLERFQFAYKPFLNPPFGENLAEILLLNKELRKSVAEIFAERGLKLNIVSAENKIDVVKERDGLFISHPYHLSSETLQRIVFMMAAIETSENSVLIFDEPESNTFPFYTKYIAERIALDDSNQYFLTTHNPYLLMNIIEKTPLKDLNVFITEMKNYQTQITPIPESRMGEALDLGMDLFFNLENFTEQ